MDNFKYFTVGGLVILSLIVVAMFFEVNGKDTTKGTIITNSSWQCIEWQSGYQHYLRDQFDVVELYNLEYQNLYNKTQSQEFNIRINLYNMSDYDVYFSFVNATNVTQTLNTLNLTKYDCIKEEMIRVQERSESI